MPHFLKPAIGLDISDRSIEAVFVVRKGDGIEVVSYGRVELPPGLVIDGHVEDQDELSLAIRKLLGDGMTPPLPNGLNRIVFALPEPQVYSHVFEVPRVADDLELGKSLAIEADGFFPYNHVEMTSGYVVTAIRPDKKDIYYAAVHKDTLKGYLQLFAASGLEPQAIEGESTSIARAIMGEEEPGPVVIVDIGARVANVAVFDRNGTQFSESLETAGDAFTTVLSRTLNIAPEDADGLKRNQGLSDQIDLKAQKALKGEAERLAKDVAAAIAYYETRSGRLVHRVVLCGGSVLMPGLAEFLAKRIQPADRPIPVEIADPWKGLSVDPDLERLGVRERGALVATAIGLALRGVNVRKFAEIDFLPGYATSAAAERRGRPIPNALPSVRTEALPPPTAAEIASGDLRAVKPPLLARLRILPTYLKVGLGVTAVLLLAGAVWAVAFVAVPRILGSRGAAETAVQAIPLEVVADLGGAYAEDPPALSSQDIEVEKKVSKSYVRASTASEGTAKGTVEIVNEGGATQALVERTRLLSEDGTLFRLDARVAVPPGGRVTAAVTADQPGAAGDVPAGRFTIPGLAAAQQRIVYGVSKEPMRGGLVLTGAPFTADDLVKARQELSSGLEEELFAMALKEVGEGDKLLRDLLILGELEVTSAPEVGKPTGDYTVEATLGAQALTFRSEEADRLLQAMLRRALPEGVDPSGYRIEGMEQTVFAFDPETLEAKLALKARAVPVQP